MPERNPFEETYGSGIASLPVRNTDTLDKQQTFRQGRGDREFNTGIETPMDERWLRNAILANVIPEEINMGRLGRVEMGRYGLNWMSPPMFSDGNTSIGLGGGINMWTDESNIGLVGGTHLPSLGLDVMGGLGREGSSLGIHKPLDFGNLGLQWSSDTDPSLDFYGNELDFGIMPEAHWNEDRASIGATLPTRFGNFNLMYGGDGPELNWNAPFNWGP